MKNVDDRNDQTVERCERLIRSFLLRHPGGPTGPEIEDCLQEAKIRLWRVLQDGRDIEYLAAYIRKIVDSIVMNRLEKVVRERAFLSSVEGRGWAEAPSGRRRENDRFRDLIDEVRGALGSLADARRAVVEMSIAGLSLREIAETRKWSNKKTYALYERGIQDLRKIFRDREGGA